MKNASLIILLALVFLNIFTWSEITSSFHLRILKIYFLDVGQGDATLIEFKTGAQVLTDAGPTNKIVGELQKFLPAGDRYLDLAVITHPQLDHFGGFDAVLDHYQIGAFIINGRQTEIPEWNNLVKKIKEKRIPLIVLAAGDEIRNQNNRIQFISPDRNLIQSAELNDTSLVSKIETDAINILLTGDIGQNVESYLSQKLGKALASEILKVPHHGSKYSSSDAFLKLVNPKLSVIEVGENRYGHPTEETLTRLEENEIAVFRTDLLGSIRLEATPAKVQLFTNSK